MQLTQLTDAQLTQQIDILGEQILGTYREEQPFFERLCEAYDRVQAELESRGLW